MTAHHQRKTLLRDVEGLLIPSGSPIVLPQGLEVQVTQALGHSFTLFVNGNLVRLYGHDADVLGLEPPSAQSQQPLEGPLTEEMVMKALKNVFDPEIPVNIVDLGLIYDCVLEQREGGVFIHVTMTLTSPACGMGPILAQDVERICKDFPSALDAHIDVVFDPPWDQSMMTDEAKLALGLI